MEQLPRKRRSGRDYVNATINFDGLAEEIGKPRNSPNARMRQMLGRTGELWWPQSGGEYAGDEGVKSKISRPEN